MRSRDLVLSKTLFILSVIKCSDSSKCNNFFNVRKEESVPVINQFHVGVLFVQATVTAAIPTVVWNTRTSLGPQFPIRLMYSRESERAVKYWFLADPMISLSPLPGQSISFPFLVYDSLIS